MQGNLRDGQALTPQLIAGAELKNWKTLLKNDYQIDLPDNFGADCFAILAINLRVNSVKYRGYFVTMTGQKDFGYFQLFILPQHYFYKNKLCFELFEESTDKLLARYSLFVPSSV
jgi:hypothetical protein